MILFTYLVFSPIWILHLVCLIYFDTFWIYFISNLESIEIISLDSYFLYYLFLTLPFFLDPSLTLSMIFESNNLILPVYYIVNFLLFLNIFNYYFQLFSLNYSKVRFLILKKKLKKNISKYNHLDGGMEFISPKVGNNLPKSDCQFPTN